MSPGPGAALPSFDEDSRILVPRRNLSPRVRRPAPTTPARQRPSAPSSDRGPKVPEVAYTATLRRQTLAFTPAPPRKDLDALALLHGSRDSGTYVVEMLPHAAPGRRRPHVTLHVYGTWCSPAAALAGVTVVHLGVELLGWELSFTQVGIRAGRPGWYDPGRYLESIDMGKSCLRCSQVKEALGVLGKKYRPEAYRLFGYNCQTFAVELLRKLGVDLRAIPARYLHFAAAEGLGCGECPEEPREHCRNRPCPHCDDDGHCRLAPLEGPNDDSSVEDNSAGGGVEERSVDRRLDLAVVEHLKSVPPASEAVSPSLLTIREPPFLLRSGSSPPVASRTPVRSAI